MASDEDIAARPLQATRRLGGPRPVVAGIGTLVVDHVFVAGDDGRYRYHGSRGGGTIWNLVAHLARAGFVATAHGAYAADGPGLEAAGELRFLGVDTAGLHAAAGKHTRVFTQRLDRNTRHGSAQPQDNFSRTCPVCRRTPSDEQIAKFSPALFAPGEQGMPAAICADRLTPATVAVARRARGGRCLSALDLGGVPDMGPSARSELSDWIGAFNLVAMPAAVASWLADGATDLLFDRLSSRGTSVLAITRGERGYELLLQAADGEVLSATSLAPDVNDVADATGAGDALMAALVAGALRLGKTGARGQRLYFRASDRDTLMAELNAAPLSVLGGIGARAGFPEYPDHTDWAKRLAALRGQPLDELQRQYSGKRPCWFCAAE